MVSQHNMRIDSDGIELAAALFTPPGSGPYPGLVICHGMPAGPQSANGGGAPAQDTGWSYPQIAELCALEGFATLIFNFRGTGASGGNFHTLGWVRDLGHVITALRESPEVDPARIACYGSSLGAAVAIHVAAQRPDVAALVSFASPAQMQRRADPEEAIARFRDMGIIQDADFPPDVEAWAGENEQLAPVEWVEKIAPRPLLMLHGDADDVVPVENAFTLFESAQEPKELHILTGVGHRFRQEPEVMETALAWLKGVLG